MPPPPWSTSVVESDHNRCGQDRARSVTGKNLSLSTLDHAVRIPHCEADAGGTIASNAHQSRTEELPPPPYV